MSNLLKLIRMQRIGILLGILLILSVCSKGHVYQNAPFDGQKVTIDIGKLKDDTPVFYTFEGIDFFIIKTGNTVDAYFDACKECYIHRKGFRYEEGRLICNYCNVLHPISTLKENGQGRCHPIRLRGEIKGQIYEIDRDELLNGSKYFN